MNKRLRIIFAGTPVFACAHLQALLASEHEVVAVYTQPDRPVGRGRQITAGPVKALALQHGIPVYQPASFASRTEAGKLAQQQLASLTADLMVVVAYGLLLPQAMLDIPPLGCINVHASLLPRWRGAAPIQRAIAAGDQQSGVTIMQMAAGLDTGDILVQAHCPIHARDTAAALHDRLITVGKPALLAAIDQLAGGTATPQPQDNSQACYAHKLTKAEGQLDWCQPASTVDCFIRALNPWPVATTTLAGQTIRVWQAVPVNEEVCHNNVQPVPGTLLAADRDGLTVACGPGELRLTRIQLPGGRAMSVAALLNSRSTLFVPGTRFC